MHLMRRFFVKSVAVLLAMLVWSASFAPSRVTFADVLEEYKWDETQVQAILPESESLYYSETLPEPESFYNLETTYVPEKLLPECMESAESSSLLEGYYYP